MTRILLTLALLICAATPEVALAQAPDDPTPEQIARAKELFENGRTLYDEGRYEDAIVAWKESYKLSGQPVLLFNIANAYERMGEYDKAIDALGRYRAFAPASERDSLDRRLKNLEERRDEQASAGPPPPDPGGSSSQGTTRSASSFPVVPVALFGAGAAALGTSAVFGLRARSARAEAEGLCVAETGLCPYEASDALARDTSSSLIADISLAVGVAALTGGTTALLLGRGDRVAISASPFGGVSLHARF
ncbi:MAG: hypothetical protein H6739_38105 [Alphaproteobacteria bacterium]|nr:hypothetical protein [Alphaproteobacteria bacterium]